MRDGKKLFTSVYVPKDLDQNYPITSELTNYELAKQGFIFVYRDVRGRNMSEGEFVNMTPHKPVKRGPQDMPKNNGRVGQRGISYPGFYAAAGMIDAHPH